MLSLSSWLSILTSLAALWLAPAGARSLESHPQDGPDVDLRVRVEARRVEVQAIVNLAFVDEVCPQDRVDADFVDPSEFEAFRTKLAETFRSSVHLKIDGKERNPDELKVEETAWDPNDAEFFPKMGMRAVVRFRVHIVYRLDLEPRSVGLIWKLYPRDLAVADLVDQNLTVNAEWSAGQDVRIVELKDSEPEYTWHAQVDSFTRPERQSSVLRAKPATTITEAVLAGLVAVLIFLVLVLAALNQPKPQSLILGSLAILVTVVGLFLLNTAEDLSPKDFSKAELRNLFETRLQGIYKAFSFRDEEDIYDALSLSVSDELIGPIYDQVHQSLVMQEEGGAVGRVKDFQSLDVTVEDRDADSAEAKIEARWQVAGEVFHWGHSHERRNEYHARYAMKWTDRGWLIDSVKTLSQERLEIPKEVAK